MSLLTLQRAFRAYLVDEPGHILHFLGPDGTAGLGVYHNAYRAQLVATLRDSFERTWAWLGDDRFDEAARAHSTLTPPSSWTLGDYGRGFSATLGALYPDDPEIAELAALDWALRRAFDGPDAAPVAAERLSEVDWDKAVIRLVPGVQLLSATTNAAAIWSAIAAGETPPAAEALAEPATIRVWRQEFAPKFATICGAERDAIEAALLGVTFAELCAALAIGEGVAQATETAGWILSEWLRDGLIVALEV